MGRVRDIGDVLPRVGALGILAAVLVAGVIVCAAVDDRPASAQAPTAHWAPTFRVPQVVDLTSPRRDGRLVVAANGRLWEMTPPHRPRPFAQGRGGYRTSIGPEAYIARATGLPVAVAGCRWDNGAVAGLDPKAGRVLLVTRDGRSRVLVRLRGRGLLGGIAFDETGRFGHRLLVTRVYQGRTTIFEIDCRGRSRTLTTTALAMEGGLVVAPATFGQYAGRLITTDEYSGHLYTIGPRGDVVPLVGTGLPSGGDVGVESTGFVPPGFGPGRAGYVADRARQPQPHPGDDTILTIDGSALTAAGVRPGDLLVAGEGGAPTVAIRCAATCTVQHVADGPATAHTEGHIVFARR